ncbi:protein of unknown function [Nitrospira japonica]|uniref:Uncharacterized protein n=1 Tax=Nitrospira japonica TaxID=1325564 RepID=A0A1W1I1A1_9BACT|nr:hypothetical protein [Nitrospira japonica]SLM46780.1 protein of unknown function [Nitrospira japonica]
MNFRQFRSPSNDHGRMVKINGRMVGGRGFRLQSKIGRGAVELGRLERLLIEARRPKPTAGL